MTMMVPVLTYHSVSECSGGSIEPYRTGPSEFAEHVDALADSGRRFVTIAELGDRLRDGGSVDGLAAVTFDDAHADVLRHALPALQRAGIPSTVFTVAATAEGAGMADAELAPLAELADLGPEVEIGSHSIDHPQLDTLSRQDIWRQVAGSRTVLAEALCRDIATFAYPHGYRDRRVRGAVRRAGYRAACGVGNAFSHAADDPLSIARVLVERRHGADDVARWMDGRGLRRAPSRDRVRTVGWRYYRRVNAWATLRGPSR